MVRFHTAWLVLVLALVANSAAAQSITSSSRDPLWNGALIGAGVGIGSTAALDAVFCDQGFGGCDTPWRGYLILGGIGAGAGAGIDYLIGRNRDPRTTSLRLAPILSPTHKGVRASLLLPDRRSLPTPGFAQEGGVRRDSVWNGTLIGAGIGAGGGFIWARNMCGSNDSECVAIATPVGMLGGIGIGAAVGAIADALHK